MKRHLQKGFLMAMVLFWLASFQSRAGEIHVAIHEDRTDDVIQMVEKNPKLLRSNDTYLNKPLHLAALEGNTNLVRFLLKKGAPVNARNKFGQTALHRVMISGVYDIAKMLLDAGAEVNGRDNQGIIPIHVAAQRRWDKIVELLIERGSEVNARDAFRRMPMHMAIMGGSDLVVSNLVKGGADYKYMDSYGNNFLHISAGSGNALLVKRFIGLKLPVDGVNKNKFTPAHFAAQSGHANVLKVLDEFGADFNLKSRGGKTPLELVKMVTPPYRMDRHDEAQAYLEEWAKRHPVEAAETAKQP